MPEDCLFCQIAKGEAPSDILYRDDTSFVIRDINPRAPTHLLVMPLQHFTYLRNVTADTEPLVGHLFSVADEMARREGIADGGYRVAINQGDNAGQTFPHLHLHVLGGKTLGPEG